MYIYQQGFRSRIMQTIPFVIFLSVLILIPYLYSCADTLTCSYRELIWDSTFTILDPALVFSQWAIISSIAILFSPKSIFRSWLRFVAWSIPLSIAFIVVTPVSSGAFMDLFPFYRNDAACLAGGLFAALSLILIIWKYFFR